MSYDTFISHSSKDKGLAEVICRNLEASGIKCWIAPRDIIGGEKWDDAIKRGIKNSRSIILVFTSNSNASQEVLKEIIQAVESNIPIIPFRIDNINPSHLLDPYISAHQWLDAFNPPVEKHIDELSDSLCRLLHITKQTGIPKDAIEILCQKVWSIDDLKHNLTEESLFIDAVSVIGTESFSEEGILLVYHTDGISPSKIAFLNIDKKAKRIRWFYTSPEGHVITKIAYADSMIHVEEQASISTSTLQRIVHLTIESGKEVDLDENEELKNIRWRRTRDLNMMRGESSIINIDGRILEIATQQKPFVKIRWDSVVSDIAMVSTVSYPLMYSRVIAVCHNLSLHCIKIMAHQRERQPELNWYSIASYAVNGYGLRLKCNKCNEISEYDPRDGHNPGNSCPACGHRDPIFNLYGW